MNRNIAEKENTERIKKTLSIANIRKGAILFIIITLIAFTCLFVFTNSGNVFEAFQSIKLEYILLSCGLAVLDWWLGGLRNHIFVREIQKGIHPRVSFYANLANIFVGAVTPSQTGGGPAQWYILHRRGIKLPDSIAISIINFISTIIFFVISGGLAIYFTQQTISSDLIHILIRSAFFLFCLGFIAIIISIWLPKPIGKLIISGVRKIRSIKGTNSNKMPRSLYRQLLNYRHTMLHFIREKPLLILLSLFLTSVMYFNKYVLAFVLLLGLGVECEFWTVITIQALIFFVIYFAPSPGASGVAEISIAVLMAQIIVSTKLATFTILHRSFLLLIPAILGSVITLRELNKQAKSQ